MCGEREREREREREVCAGAGAGGVGRAPGPGGLGGCRRTLWTCCRRVVGCLDGLHAGVRRWADVHVHQGPAVPSAGPALRKSERTLPGAPWLFVCGHHEGVCPSRQAGPILFPHPPSAETLCSGCPVRRTGGKEAGVGKKRGTTHKGEFGLVPLTFPPSPLSLSMRPRAPPRPRSTKNFLPQQ